MQTQPNFAEMVIENLTQQNAILNRELAFLKAELDMTKMEIESLKQLQEKEEEVQ